VVQFFKPSGSSKQGHKNKGSVPKGKPQTLYIDVLDQHGKGIALSTQPITVVEGALPKETLSVHILSESKSVRQGKIVSIETPSPERIKASCPVYEACGGCNLQILSAEKGLFYKQDALARYFNRVLKINTDVWQTPVRADIDYSDAQNNIGYRRKVRLAVDARQQASIKIGYRQSGSHKIIDINTCPILLPQLAERVERLLPLLKTLRCIHKVGHIECTLTANGIVLLMNFTKALSKLDVHALEELSEAARVRLIGRSKEGGLCDFGKSFATLKKILYR